MAGLRQMQILTHQEVLHITVRQEVVDLQLADLAMEDLGDHQDLVTHVLLQLAQDQALSDHRAPIPDPLGQLLDRQDLARVTLAQLLGHLTHHLLVVLQEDLAVAVA